LEEKREKMEILLETRTIVLKQIASIKVDRQ
jgi:hypothetical protein